MDQVFRKRLTHTECQVLQNRYYQSFLRFLLAAEYIQITRIVAYGLGKVSMAIPAMHQAVFCSQLAKRLQVPLSAYDPIFSADDLDLLKHLGYQEEVFPFAVSPLEKTLVFMPHCDVAVNNAVLEHLARHPNNQFLLFCNTLTSEQLQSVSTIERLYDISGEYARVDVFNNCSVYSLNIPHETD